MTTLKQKKIELQAKVIRIFQVEISELNLVEKPVEQQLNYQRAEIPILKIFNNPSPMKLQITQKIKATNVDSDYTYPKKCDFENYLVGVGSYSRNCEFFFIFSNGETSYRGESD